jgi:glyoxylase-like metal-dependent hydrolase (beta-lactamase superfamily II)
MIRRLFFPGLLDTGPVLESVLAVRDGFMNFYVIKAPAGLVCVDAGWRPARNRRSLESLGLDPRDVVAVCLTHLHWDHARGTSLFPKAQVFVGEQVISDRALRRLECSCPVKRVREGELFTVSGLDVQVVETTGHLAGSVAYVFDRRFLFTGDALRLRRGEVLPFWRCFNRDQRTHVRSIQKLAGLEGLESFDGLFTGHSGACRDVARAFRLWRPLAGGGSNDQRAVRQPGGLTDTSRGASEANPPECDRKNNRTPEECQRQGAPTGDHSTHVCHPSGVGFRFPQDRGCRFARPPANIWYPSGIRVKGCEKHRRQRGEVNFRMIAMLFRLLTSAATNIRFAGREGERL